ncbi:AAA family ATPase [Nocardioides campestrisoli]|uniref:AAA family ATPase n=1 Tax=Nocardioides campestrisoli TaxID=2736757 RepID=UPI0015E7E464|nr:chromosome partitioning protein [Nocardioides campestrisoli]
MVCVLVLASGAGWESEALTRLGEASRVVVLKRCVDVDDLMATAATGQADVALVALEAPGLDRSAVEHLRRHGVRPVAVVADPGRDDVAARLARLDVGSWLPAEDLAELAATVSRAEDLGDTRAGSGSSLGILGAGTGPGDWTQPETLGPSGAGGPGRVVAVWGPAGAPGRTTVATATAAEMARRGTPTLLVDADPHAASVAQHLGVLDQVSGVLAASRLVAAGTLHERLPATCRTVAPCLAVMTGLPRPDRWVEVRPGVLGDVLEASRSRGSVVVDTGPDLAVDHAAGPAGARNTMTLEALEAADEILVVGAADPVGLSRLARALVDVREVVGSTPLRVVVNRMRPSLGWSEADVVGMVEGFARVSALHFLPDDRAAVDRALVAGRALGEVGDSSVSRAVARLTDAVDPGSLGASGARRGGRAGRGRLARRVRPRTAGTARPR